LENREIENKRRLLIQDQPNGQGAASKRKEGFCHHVKRTDNDTSDSPRARALQEIVSPAVETDSGAYVGASSGRTVCEFAWHTKGLVVFELLKGLEVRGIFGVMLVTAGHWLADFGYYRLVSFIVYDHSIYVNPGQRQILILLGLFLTVLGLYFLEQGLEKLLP